MLYELRLSLGIQILTTLIYLIKKIFFRYLRKINQLLKILREEFGEFISRMYGTYVQKCVFLFNFYDPFI